MRINRRKIFADEMIDAPEVGGVDVAPEATELLFEAEDVAELVAEVTGEPVEVSVDDTDDTVTFTVGDSDYVVEAEGDEEILESVRKPMKNKRPIKASTRTGRVVKKFPSKKTNKR